MNATTPEAARTLERLADRIALARTFSDLETVRHEFQQAMLLPDERATLGETIERREGEILKLHLPNL